MNNPQRFSIALVDPTGQLLADIEDKRLRQGDIAADYALAMRQSSEVDWRKVNQAIIERWSISGLRRVKQMAWKLISA